MPVMNGGDFKNCNMGTALTNLYYYILDKKLITGDEHVNTQPFSSVPTIQSISFNPFADLNDFEVIRCKFNSEKFGDTSGKQAYVYRIKHQNVNRKTLKEIPLFNSLKDGILNDITFSS